MPTHQSDVFNIGNVINTIFFVNSEYYLTGKIIKRTLLILIIKKIVKKFEYFNTNNV